MSRNNMLAGYGLEHPTAERSLASLERMVGSVEAEARWSEACQAAQVTWPAPSLDLAQLTRVANQLCAEPDLVSVIGRSLLVRITTYKSIQRRLESGGKGS